MKYLKIVAILCVLIFVGCNSNNIERPKKPKNLIKKQDMVNILYDMSILTASKGVNKKLLEENGVFPEDFVYEKYGIDSVQFALSNEYYAYKLETYEEIFNQVKNRLTEEKKVLDSIKNIEAEERKKRRDQEKSTRAPEVETIIPSKKIDTSQVDIRQ
ncbi:DUF4296 domain-containing protein [Pontimicrobium aquaticum]|uniref:DUF4296 domain-containing protein n=1 Tax=Pontimicrobium aquaticum TaxID=2565367 RepID=A0A4U0F139_9FLAO|nr:DUF4296 domain-containing protein [Pontimicrobium aquaticum]TJY37970.1 DUF4296 domain-containing protein [Pontimicrobium aquaticum]